MSGSTTDSAEPLLVTFLGTTSLYIRNGHTALLTDGFFSRPGLAQVLFGKISPNPARVAAGLTAAAIQHLDAVLVGHSHYDHALDAPEVARQTSALLVGSDSTAQIGRGWGLAEDQIRIIQPGKRLTVGDFAITFIPSKHSQPLLFPGSIPRPLVPPARSSSYKEGGSYSILIASPSASILVQESANSIPDSLSGQHARTVFLSVAQLGRRSPGFTQRYFEEVVLAVAAKRVIPIHWDNFQKPSQDHLATYPAWMDNTARAMDRIQEQCQNNQIEFQLIPYGGTIAASA